MNLQVCFLAGTLGQGGAERQLFHILQALRNGGAGLRLLCLTRGEFWEEPIRSLGIPVEWVGDSPRRIARLLRIARSLCRDKPQILQSQHFYTNLYAVGAARTLGLREIGAIRNDADAEVSANGRLGLLSLRAPRALAANSLAGMRNAAAMGVETDRLHLLPNVVDTDRFTPGPVFSRPVLTILTAGRLVDQKRMDRVLRILARIRSASGRRVRGLLVGDGPLRAALEREAEGLGLGPDAVEFRGTVAEMLPVYREADLFLLASAHEGTPNVLLEAMACGLPVVATAVGGVPDLVRDGETGCLADPADEEGLAAAVAALAADPARRAEIAGRARASVEERHSLRALPGHLDRLYRSILS